MLEDAFGHEVPSDGRPVTVASLGDPIGFALVVDSSEGPHCFQWAVGESGRWECIVSFQCGNCDELHSQRMEMLDADHPAEACGQLEALACACWVATRAVEETVMKEGEELLEMTDEDFNKWLKDFSE